MKSRQLVAYDHVLLARDAKRPKIDDYIQALFTDFIELKGDRLGMEDAAILGGIAFFEQQPVTVIGHRKGNNLEENLKYNFGMPAPEGYRKAMRLMKQAEKFSRPVITFIDTPGAYPGLEAEANGQSTAIAECLAGMSQLKVPVICIVTGEGNSGGALAIGVGNVVLMMENAVYSILSPEGFASILWKDATKNKEACEVMKMTAGEIYEMGLIDGIIPEPEGGIQTEPELGYKAVGSAIKLALKEFEGMNGQEIASKRYEKFRNIEGVYHPIRKEK